MGGVFTTDRRSRAKPTNVRLIRKKQKGISFRYVPSSSDTKSNTTPERRDTRKQRASVACVSVCVRRFRERDQRARKVAGSILGEFVCFVILRERWGTEEPQVKSHSFRSWYNTYAHSYIFVDSTTPFLHPRLSLSDAGSALFTFSLAFFPPVPATTAQTQN